MSVLTSGRIDPCKDNVGGIKEIWLSNFIPYSQSLITGYRDMLVTSHPTTLMFKYEGVEKSFKEDIRDDMGYDQELTLKCKKQDVSTLSLLGLVQKSRVIAVVVDNLGKIRIAGLHNGLDVELNATTGSGKADFNGYELKLSGNEPFKAPFINAFPGSGFVKDGVEYSCLYSSSGRPSSISDKVSSCNVIV